MSVQASISVYILREIITMKRADQFHVSLIFSFVHQLIIELPLSFSSAGCSLRLQESYQKLLLGRLGPIEYKMCALQPSKITTTDRVFYFSH